MVTFICINEHTISERVVGFVTIILARIFLKERLTKKQYLSLALVIIGIALLGISEIISI